MNLKPAGAGYPLASPLKRNRRTKYTFDKALSECVYPGSFRGKKTKFIRIKQVVMHFGA